MGDVFCPLLCCLYYYSVDMYFILNNTFQFWTDHLSAFTATCTVFLKLLCFVFAWASLQCIALGGQYLAMWPAKPWAQYLPLPLPLPPHAEIKGLLEVLAREHYCVSVNMGQRRRWGKNDNFFKNKDKTIIWASLFYTDKLLLFQK